MINKIKKMIPKSFKDFYKYQKSKKSIVNDFIYDYKRYVKNYASINLKNKENMQAFLIKEYHAIEKGLALRYSKPGFGEARISKLIGILCIYMEKYGIDSITDITIRTLEEYKDFDKRNNKEENKVIVKIDKVISNAKLFNKESNLGGTKTVHKRDILSTIQFDYGRFVQSRYSTRDYTDVPVEKNVILDAINNARYTPSVCNRQAWKVYIIDHSNPELKDKFLKVQNGNRGFGEYISSLIVITGRLSSFFDYERNQVFIDGGMFAMSVLLALHAKGLGTCCLNTSYNAQKNEEFRSVMEMDEDCVPIMFIAVGNLKEEYKVAVSQRKALQEIVTVL